MGETLEASRDNRAEVLLRFFGQAQKIDALKGKSVREVLASDESRRDFVESLSDTDFVGLLDGLNGILRDKPKEEWKMDGNGVVLRGFLGGNTTPDFKDKPELLRELLAGAKKMSSEGRSMEDIGLLFGVGIVEIHPYMDGNGRVGRLAYSLMKDGLNENELREILGSYGSDSMEVNVQVVESFVNDLIAKRIMAGETRNVTNLFYESTAELRFDPGVPERVQKEFRDFLKQSAGEDMIFLSIYEYVRVNDLDCLKYFPAGELKGKQLPEQNVIQLERLTSLLDEAAIQEIMARFWALKRETAELLIDSIVHPEKPEYDMKQWSGGGRFKDQGSILDYIKMSILKARTRQ